MRSAPSSLVLVPTYREARNIGAVVRGVRAALPGATVWVVDDASDDGTADEAREAGADVLVRRGARGLGAAYREAYERALEHEADVVYQLDGDGTHAPSILPRLGAALGDGADLALGTRRVRTAVPGWPPTRRLLSSAAGWWTRAWLDLSVADPTSGMRAWRRSTLESVAPHTLVSRGYAVQVETLARAVRAGARVTEVPIVPLPREHGRSKLHLSVAWEAAWRIPTWR